MSREVLATAATELWAGEMLGVCLDGTPVLLVNVDGTIRAYRDRCAHLGVKLSEGRLEDATLTCRVHHWQYDALTGRGLNPTEAALAPLPVTVRNGDIWVQVEDADG